MHDITASKGTQMESIAQWFQAAWVKFLLPGLVYIVGGWDAAVWTLLGFQILDFYTAILAGKVTRENFDWARFQLGMYKKLLGWGAVFGAVMLQRFAEYVTIAGHQGIDTHDAPRIVVFAFLIRWEGVSVKGHLKDGGYDIGKIWDSMLDSLRKKGGEEK